MKRKNNLYDNILREENILSVFKTIKQNCKNKREIYKFLLNYNQNVMSLREKLINENYKFSKYRLFLIREPKYRLIMSECIEDKIVNHLVAKYIMLPALDSSLIDSNVATRIGRGSDYAFNLFLKYVKSLLRFRSEIYILKIDIKKYFYNIDHNKCYQLVCKKIKDKRSLKIIRDIINTTNESYINQEIKSLIYKETIRVKSLNISEREKELKINELSKIPLYLRNKGLPIGNMTSQILAVYYLNELDHFIKENLKVKYYIRYMDDLLLIHRDKDFLRIL